MNLANKLLWLIVAVLLLFLLLAPPPARAQPLYRIRVDFSHPSLRADGSPLPADQLAKYKLYWTCNSKRQGVTTIFASQTLPVELDGPWLGRCDFSITAVDTNGNESARSPVVVAIIKLPKPAQGGLH